jgi:hypothetical protein
MLRASFLGSLEHVQDPSLRALIVVSIVRYMSVQSSCAVDALHVSSTLL